MINEKTKEDGINKTELVQGDNTPKYASGYGKMQNPKQSRVNIPTIGDIKQMISETPIIDFEHPDVIGVCDDEGHVHLDKPLENAIYYIFSGNKPGGTSITNIALLDTREGDNVSTTFFEFQNYEELLVLLFNHFVPQNLELYSASGNYDVVHEYDGVEFKFYKINLGGKPNVVTREIEVPSGGQKTKLYRHSARIVMQHGSNHDVYLTFVDTNSESYANKPLSSIKSFNLDNTNVHIVAYGYNENGDIGYLEVGINGLYFSNYNYSQEYTIARADFDSSIIMSDIVTEL